MTKGLLVLSVMLLAAPAFADNCSGEFVNVKGGTSNPVNVGAGKALFFAGDANSNTVTSTDTPYNGTGSCTGYVYEQDGKAYISDLCVRTTSNGDSWGVVGTYNPETKRGVWRALFGTGKLAKNMGSTGWFEVVADDEKKTSGKWGGNCIGVK
jgi:hypothetical protein